jgi:hypothetical protein
MPNRPPKRSRRSPKIKTVESQARLVPSMNAIRLQGDYSVTSRGRAMCGSAVIELFEIAMLLPGHERPSGIIVRKVDDIVRAGQVADHIWNWNGNSDRPTVNPEIFSRDVQDGAKPWRGYLLNGQFIAVA